MSRLILLDSQDDECCAALKDRGTISPAACARCLVDCARRAAGQMTTLVSADPTPQPRTRDVPAELIPKGNWFPDPPGSVIMASPDGDEP